MSDNPGTNNRVHMSGPCFCHPQQHPAQFHQFPQPKPEKPARVFSQPKSGDDAIENEDNTIKQTNTLHSNETCDSTEAEPPSRTSPCLE